MCENMKTQHAYLQERRNWVWRRLCGASCGFRFESGQVLTCDGVEAGNAGRAGRTAGARRTASLPLQAPGVLHGDRVPEIYTQKLTLSFFYFLMTTGVKMCLEGSTPPRKAHVNSQNTNKSAFSELWG
jgi:hypothetical protein